MVRQKKYKISFLKYFFALAGLVWINGDLLAQTTIYRWAHDGKKLEGITGVKDGDYYFIAGQSGDHFIIYCFNPSKNFTDRYEMTRLGGRIIGYSSDESEVIIYFESTHQESFTDCEFVVYSKITNSFEIRKGLDTITEKSISYISQGNFFYSLSWIKKSDSLVLSRIDKGDKVTRSSFFISDKEWQKRLGKNEFDFFPAEHQIPFTQAQNQNKIYFPKDKILIITDEADDDKDAVTRVAELDLIFRSVRTQVINLPYSKKIKHNSFFFEGQLFILAIEKTKLTLSIYETTTWKKVKEFQITESETIPFKNSDLIKDGVNIENDWRYSGLTDYDIAQRTLKELNEGNIPVISVSGFAEKKRLLIGSFKFQKVINGGNATVPLGGGAISTPYGNSNLPVTFMHVGSNGGGRDVVSNTSEFYGYLERDLSPDPDNKYKYHGPFLKLDKRVIELNNKFKLGGMGMINSVEGPYLIYLFKENKTIVVDKF